MRWVFRCIRDHGSGRGTTNCTEFPVTVALSGQCSFGERVTGLNWSDAIASIEQRKAAEILPTFTERGGILVERKLLLCSRSVRFRASF